MMKYPSESSREHLLKLREALRPPGSFRFQGNPTPHLAALTETGKIAILRDLIGIAVEAGARKRSDCLSAISAIVKPLLPDRLPELDESFRLYRYVLVQQDDPWSKLTRKVVEGLPLAGPNDEVLLGLCASHCDGYIREAAVARQAQIHSGLELGFLIMRANDWVSEVQIRARTALLERLSAAYAQAFIRRRCYELAYRAYISDVPDWLYEKAMADPDVVIRHRAFVEILNSNRPLSSTLVQRGINDVFAPIRRRIFDCSVRSGGAKDADLVRTFLFDCSTQLRQDAQRFWRERNSAILRRFTANL
jgi:hypothetical protein